MVRQAHYITQGRMKMTHNELAELGVFILTWALIGVGCLMTAIAISFILDKA